jgi:glycosyltransferase involved in cell wall biosynthesis
MHFSVVIPLYNKETSIERVIRSVLQQTHPDFELIIVNDGSTDNSLAEVEKFRDSRIRIIDQPNAGVSAARNKGVEEAKFDYISFLDADDWWDINYLEEVNKLILDFPDAVAFATSLVIVENTKITSPESILPESFRGEITNYSNTVYQSVLKYRKNKAIQNQTLFHSSSITINREVFNKSKGFNTKLKIMEDWELFFRIGELGKVAYYNKDLAHYNKDSENRSSGVLNRDLHEYACFNNEIINYYKDKSCAAYFWNHVGLAQIREYYFSVRRPEAVKVIKKLNFKDQPYKWVVLYKWPYIISYLINKLLLLKLRLKK